MIDLSDEQVIEQLHQEGWRKVPEGHVVMSPQDLRKLIFNNLDESDRDWIEGFVKGKTFFLNGVGMSDDGSGEHNRVLDGGDGQPSAQPDQKES